MSKHDDKGEQGLAIIEQMLGQKYSDIMRKAAAARTFASALTRLAIEYAYADGWARQGLPLSDKSLVVIAALTVLEQSEELKNHVRLGLANGLSESKINAAKALATELRHLPNRNCASEKDYPLSLRATSLVAIAALIALKQPEELKEYVKLGVAQDVSVEEFEDVVILLSSYVGIPRVSTGKNAIVEALQSLDINVDAKSRTD